MKTNGNDPASPVLTQSASLQNETSLGLTKRERFAMAAMQSGTFDKFPDHVKASVCGEDQPHYFIDNFEGGQDAVMTYGEPYVAWLLRGISKYAVMQADALISALNEGGENG